MRDELTDREQSLLVTYVCLKKLELDMSYIEEEVKKLGIDVYERENRLLAHHLFSGRGLTPENKKMLRYILSSGTYGTMTHLVRNRVKENGGSKIRYMSKRFFIPFRKKIRFIIILRHNTHSFISTGCFSLRYWY